MPTQYLKDSNPLIGDHLADAQMACADMLDYLQIECISENPNQLSPEQENGRFWILHAVEQTLRFEAQRVTLPSDLRAVSNG